MFFFKINIKAIINFNITKNTGPNPCWRLFSNKKIILYKASVGRRTFQKSF